ncbi:MAG: hypothetical protein KJ949_02645 [Nanoarchaeota archaeon]|nr:hypothetical protein [Nanoarchaeota archaeon]
MTDLNKYEKLFRKYYEVRISQKPISENQRKVLSNLEVDLESVVFTGKEILEMGLGIVDPQNYETLKKELKELRKRNITLEIKYDKLQKETKSCLNKSKKLIL